MWREMSPRSSRRSRLPRSGLAVLRASSALAGVACVLLAGLAGLDDLQPAARAWLLTAGFGLIAISLLLPPIRSYAALFLALTFLVFGGLSAVVAVPEPPAEQAERAASLTDEQVQASTPSASYETALSPDGFRHA